MRQEKTTLVMAGAREAHSLVTSLLTRRRQVIASIPEPERMFGPLPVPTRVGRFETAEELEAWLAKNNVATVIDASHAFDTDVGMMAGEACTRLKLRYIRVLRPPWVETIKDQWHHVSSVSEAVELLPDHARVFSNTGWATLPEYELFSGRKLYMRQTHEASRPALYPFIEFIKGTPPFSQFQEQSLFEQLRVTHLVCRNVGGAASMSKLLAARSLGLPVYMVARQPVPQHLPVVETTAEALAWEANA